MLLGIALEVAAAWTLVVEAGKDSRGDDVLPGRKDATELPRAGQDIGLGPAESRWRAQSPTVRSGYG
jgi:hypothetical protein